MIFFTAYAYKKFSVLERHAVMLQRDEVMEVVMSSDAVSEEKAPLLFARKKLHDGRNVCVVYKMEGELRKIITFYPL